MKKVFILGMIIFCSIMTVGCGCSKEKDKEEEEKVVVEELSGKFFENQVVDTLEIQNFNIAEEDGFSYIAFDVKNTLDQPASVQYIKFYLYDDTEHLILESYGYVGGTINALGTTHVVVDVDIDLSAVASVKYERM